MRYVALVMGLCIAAVGLAGVVAPRVLVGIADLFVTPGAFHAIALVRIAFGLLLISLARGSRMPRGLLVVGVLIVLAGITAGLVGSLALDRSRAMIEGWERQGPFAVRLAGLLLVALGGFIAYACTPTRPMRSG